MRRERRRWTRTLVMALVALLLAGALSVTRTDGPADALTVRTIYPVLKTAQFEEDVYGRVGITQCRKIYYWEVEHYPTADHVLVAIQLPDYRGWNGGRDVALNVNLQPQQPNIASAYGPITAMALKGRTDVRIEVVPASTDSYRGGLPAPYNDDIPCSDPDPEFFTGYETYNAFVSWNDDQIAVTCSVDSQYGPGGATLGFSASVDAGGSGYQQEWTFSDGTTSNASLVSKQAALPGTFTGTFRAWIPGTAADETTTCGAEVKAPELAVGISFPGREVLNGIPNTTFEVGEEVPVRVHLRATDDGVGALSDVRFLDDALRIAPEGAATLVSGPTPEVPEDLSLAPGDELTFDHTIVVERPGAFTLLSSAAGKDVIDRPVGPVEASAGARGGSLTVKATASPDTLDLEESDDNDGPEPEPVTLTVEVTNPLPDAVESATLSVVEPEMVSATPIPVGHSAFHYVVPGEGPSGEAGPGIPADVDLGTLEPGEKATRTFSAMATDSGSVDLAFIVRGAVDGAAVSGTDTTRVEVRTEIDFVFDAGLAEGTASSPPEGASGAWVTGGGQWELSGSLQNRTADTTLEVVLAPLLEGNAHYGVIIPNDTTPPDQECGLGSVRQLEPGETVRFRAPVRTTLDGGTRSAVGYQPLVYEVEEDGTRTPLDPEKVLVTPGSERHQVSVDTQERAPEQSAGEVLWAYGQGTIDAIGETFAGMAQLAIAATELGLQPWTWPEAYNAAGTKVSEYVLTIYENLSPADKAAWNASWVDAVALATGMTLDDARTMVDRMAAESFGQLEQAWYTGDYVTVARWWGTQTGNNIDTVIGGLTKAYGVCKLISAKAPWAKTALLAKEAKVAEELAELGAGATVKNVPTGATITRDLRRRLWGIDDEMYAAVQRFVDDFKVSIGVRRRGPGSLAKIEAGTHNPKVYLNKAKNISQADVDWFSFVDDLDTSAIKEPPLAGEVLQKLNAAGVDADTKAAVMARHKTRMEEWYGKGVNPFNGTGGDFTRSQRYKWATYANDGLPVPRNGGPLDYAQNVSAGRSLPSDDVLYRKVPARIRTYAAPDGKPMMVLEMDYGDGFKPMTGDMDPLVVTNADFSQLSEARRVEFYERAYDLGFEHVESASWNDPGRNDYILEHSVRRAGSEAMFTWVPGSEPRATRFDPQMSWVDPTSVQAGAIYLRGTNVALKSARPVLGEADYSLPDAGGGLISPKTIFLVDPNCGGPAGAQSTGLAAPAADAPGQCRVVFDRGPDALVLRQTTGGAVERWSQDDGWQPFTITAAGDVRVLPQSVSTAAVGAGATEVEIASAADLGLVAGLDQWFAVGDLVVLDPGGPDEEYAVIGAFGSLVFTQPLQHDHPAGTLISVVEANGDPTSPADPNGPVLPDPGAPPTSPPPTTPGAGVDQDPSPTPSANGVGATVPTPAPATAVAPTGGALPFTGTDPAPLVGAGALLLAAGGAGWGASRRSRRRTG